MLFWIKENETVIEKKPSQQLPFRAVMTTYLKELANIEQRTSFSLGLLQRNTYF